jgi:hypothetical protein
VAERVARREELQLHHVIAIGGDPTGGHVALWRALAAEGKDAAALSAILGWPAAVIEASLARPKPKLVAPIPAAPKSGPRAVRAPAVDIAAVIEAALAPLRADVAALRQEAAARPPGPSKAELHFARYGAAGEVVREMAYAAGVPLDLLLADNSSRLSHVVRLRVQISLRFTAAPWSWSQPAIGDLLCQDHSSISYQIGKGRPVKEAS